MTENGIEIILGSAEVIAETINADRARWLRGRGSAVGGPDLPRRLSALAAAAPARRAASAARQWRR
jgi:hypothetical protein